MSAAPTFGPGIAERLLPSIERLYELVDTASQMLRVALPAVVQSFNAGPPATVTVQPAVQELARWNQGSVDQPNIQTKAVSLPVLADVPVLMPSAGGWSVTFPIQPGDECLLVFSDTALDSWFQSGGTSNYPISTRRHSLSDAIAVFGLRSQPRGLQNYSSGSCQVRNDAANVILDLAPNQITLTAPNISINASQAVSIQAQTITISGSQGVTITGNQQTKIEGKTFLTHLHTGVQSGGSDTGPVA
jgi:hypothetical protein